MRSKYVALTKYTIFVSVVSSTDVLYLYVITFRGGKQKKIIMIQKTVFTRN